MKHKIVGIVSVLVLLTVILSGCAKQDEPQKETGLYDYKTQYVGDNSKVLKLVNALDYPNKAVPGSIEIKSDKEPYELIVYLQGENINADDLFHNAVISFALIDNAAVIEYRNASSKELIADFVREDVDKELAKDGEKSCAEIGADKDSFYGYLNQ